jgi:hypothetical protein
MQVGSIQVASVKHVDMRKLPLAAQEEPRRQVIQTGVFDICKQYAERGGAGLKTGQHGLDPGYGQLLTAERKAETQDLVRRRTPDALDLPFALSWVVGTSLRRNHCGGTT